MTDDVISGEWRIADSVVTFTTITNSTTRDSGGIGNYQFITYSEETTPVKKDKPKFKKEIKSFLDL